MRAYSLIRKEPHYRAEAFLAGLRAAGYQALPGQPHWPGRRGEVLVVWNRYGETERLADRFEADGGTVLVAENGYLGAGGTAPKFDVAAKSGPQPGHHYALAEHAHNGRGRWTVGQQAGQGRFAALGVPLAPMKTGGDYVLIAPNRSFGMRGGVMPHDWAERTAAELRGQGQTVRIRHHPGNLASRVPLAQELAGASRVVIWSSSVGVAALVAGVPVECRAPWWICKGWEQTGREAALERMAWAQWTVEEIARGVAFRHLLSGAGQEEVAVAV